MRIIQIGFERPCATSTLYLTRTPEHEDRIDENKFINEEDNSDLSSGHDMNFHSRDEVTMHFGERIDDRFGLNVNEQNYEWPNLWPTTFFWFVMSLMQQSYDRHVTPSTAIAQLGDCTQSAVVSATWKSRTIRVYPFQRAASTATVELTLISSIVTQSDTFFQLLCGCFADSVLRFGGFPSRSRFWIFTWRLANLSIGSTLIVVADGSLL